jgi:hypothetical protein
LVKCFKEQNNMAILSPYPFFQLLDGNGRPYAGGLVYTYEAGSSTPKVTYKDGTGDANTNPVILDSDGRADIWLDTGAYKMVFTDGQGASIFDPGTIEGNVYKTVDNINLGTGTSFAIVDTYSGLSGLSGSANSVAIIRGYNSAYDGGYGVYCYDTNTSTWVLLYNGNVDVRWFGAVGDGVTNDTTAFTNANSFAASVQLAIVAYSGNYLLSSDPVLMVPIELKSNAVLKWSGFNLNVNPVIPISDTGRHFNFLVGTDDPVFPANSDIKMVWLTGVSTSVITDNGGTWTAGNAIITINGTAYTQSWVTDKNTSMIALASQINGNTAVSGATYSAVNHNITVHAGNSISIITNLTGITGSMTFAVNGSGWTQHSLALQSDMLAAQNNITNLDGAVSQSIILADSMVICTDNGGTWTGGSIAITVNGTLYSQTYDGTGKDTSMAALAALVAADSDVFSAIYSSGGHTIVITPKPGATLTVTADTSGVAGTIAITVATGGTWTAGTANIYVNGVLSSYTYLTSKAASLAILAAQIKTNCPDVSASTYALNAITIKPNAGKCLYVTADLSEITGNMVLDVQTNQINSIATLNNEMAAAQTKLSALTNNTADPQSHQYGTFELDFSNAFGSTTISHCSYVLDSLYSTIINDTPVSGAHGTWVSGIAAIIINGVTYSQAYNGAKDTSMVALANKVAADPNALSCVYDSYGANCFTITPRAGKTLAVSFDLSGLTGGSTMAWSKKTIYTQNVRVSLSAIYNTASGLESNPIVPYYSYSGSLKAKLPVAILPQISATRPIGTLGNTPPGGVPAVKNGYIAIADDGTVGVYYDIGGGNWPTTGSCGFEGTTVAYSIVSES